MGSNTDRQSSRSWCEEIWVCCTFLDITTQSKHSESAVCTLLLGDLIYAIVSSTTCCYWLYLPAESQACKLSSLLDIISEWVQKRKLWSLTCSQFFCEPLVDFLFLLSRKGNSYQIRKLAFISDSNNFILCCCQLVLSILPSSILHKLSKSVHVHCAG